MLGVKSVNNKYQLWNGTRQDLINEIIKLEDKDPQAYKMYSKNTGKFISINLRRVQQFIDDGLIPPPTKENKDKQYNEEHLLRYIATIKLKNEGYSLKLIQPILSSYKLEDIVSKILNSKNESLKFIDDSIDKIEEINISKNLIKLGREEGKVLTSQWTKFAVTKWFNAEINNRKLNNLTSKEVDILMIALKATLIENINN